MEKGNFKKNTALNMIKTMSSIMFPLMTFPYIARVLQPENYGIYNFGVSIVSYFTALGTFGITAYAVRECSRVKDDKALLGQTASEIMSINICTTAVSYAALSICLLLSPAFHGYELVIGILGVNILFSAVGTDWLNTVMEDFQYITIRYVLFQILSLILMFVFVKQGSDYIKYAVITVVAASGAQICNIIYRRRFCRVCFTFRLNLRKHLPPIMLLFVVLVSQTILGNIDVTMLGLMNSVGDVGLYSSAVKIVNIVNQVISSICWVVLPQLSQGFSNQSYERINEILHKVLAFSITLTLPCMAGIGVMSEEIITIVGGSGYISAANCLFILACSMPFYIAYGVFGGIILLASGREKQFAVVCLVGMLVNGTLNYLLIPRFGINGVAIVSVLTYLVLWLGSMVKFDKRISFLGISRMFVGPVSGSVVIVLIGLLIRHCELGFWIRTAISFLLCVTAYTAIQILTKNELALEVSNIIRRNLRRKSK